jgi:RND family efflux transporter MFP subunit
MSQPKPNLDDLRIQGRDQRRGNYSFLTLSAGVALVMIAIGLWWWFNRDQGVAVRVVAARAAGGTAGERTVLNASGYVTARRSATVSSKVTGKVVEVLIEEGMRVQEGQVLARLESSNIQASLSLAEARVDSARKSLEETRVRIEEAERELRRQTDLLANKIATQADFERAEAALLALKARLVQQQSEIEVAQREVAAWQQQMDDTIIRAPFGGIVTSKNAQPGEMISPVSAGGGFTRTGICTIVDMQSLEIEIDVNESYINRVEPGQSVEAVLDAYPDWKIPCKVIAIIPTADRQKSTVKVRVGFDKLDKKILPEMSVKVSFRELGGAAGAVEGGRMVTVPRSAVRQEGGTDLVFIVVNGRVERRAATVAGSQGDDVLLSAGVSAGEKVAAEFPGNLKDGMRVRAH